MAVVSSNIDPAATNTHPDYLLHVSAVPKAHAVVRTQWYARSTKCTISIFKGYIYMAMRHVHAVMLDALTSDIQTVKNGYRA